MGPAGAMKRRGQVTWRRPPFPFQRHHPLPCLCPLSKRHLPDPRMKNQTATFICCFCIRSFLEEGGEPADSLSRVGCLPPPHPVSHSQAFTEPSPRAGPVLGARRAEEVERAAGMSRSFQARTLHTQPKEINNPIFCLIPLSFLGN